VDLLLGVTAVAAGLVSFASPCVLPLVPAYLGYITGRSAEELRAAHGAGRLAITAQALAFVLGLALVFAVLGATASLLGQTLPLLWKLGGLLVILMGLHMLGLFRLPVLDRTVTLSAPLGARQSALGTGLLGAFLVGLAFGAGWTPCVGPFLAGILALASSQATAPEGVLLLLLYALGLGIPFLLAGLAVDQARAAMAAARPHVLTLERAGGVLLVGMGLLLATERLTLITAWLTRAFGTGLAL
jgi:cytochrome c-type biogenesis protein